MSPAVTFAEETTEETTEESTQVAATIQASILLTKAEQTENGVFLEWETTSNSDLTKLTQTFSVLKNGESETITAHVNTDQSSTNKQVFSYIDPVEKETPVEYSISWTVDEQSFTSNSINATVPSPLEEEATKEDNPDLTEVEADTEPVVEVDTNLENETSEAAKEETTPTKLPSPAPSLLDVPGVAYESELYLDKFFVNENSFTVFWFAYAEKQIGRIATYELYLNEELVKRDGTRFTEYEFTGLTPETSYEVKVKALNSQKVVLLEETIQVKTLPLPRGEIVSFPDKNLEAAVKENLHIDRDLFESDLEGLTFLFAPEYGIKKISGLEKAVNLKYLTLYYNEITDLKPLASLTKLEHIDLDTNKIKNISPLAGLTKLNTLWLNDNPISNIDTLSKLEYLENLFLHNTSITSLKALENLDHISTITLEGTNIDYSEGSADFLLLKKWAEAGVYIDVFDEEYIEPLDIWIESTSESTITLSWGYYFENEDAYEEEYTFHVYVNEKLYKKTKETWLTITGLQAQKDYVIKVEMYDNKGNFLFDTMEMAQTLPAPTGEIVTFKDAALAEAIRNQLGLPKRDIHQSDMERLDYLYTGDNGDIKDLAGLEKAIFLEDLDISDNQLKSLMPLAKLEHLVSLSAANNKIKDISVIKNLNLYYLDLSGNPISDISAISSMKDLETLYLHYTNITDISVLLELPFLNDVTLFGIDGLSFEEGTPEYEVLQELLKRNVTVYLHEEDFYETSDLEINVTNVTSDSIEVKWTYLGEEEVTSYIIGKNGDFYDILEETTYLFEGLEADTHYSIEIVALDANGDFVDFNFIEVSTLPYEEEEEGNNTSPPPAKETDKEKPKNENVGKTPTKVEPTPAKPNTKNKLPNTATNSMNFMFIGLALLVIGIGAGWFGMRRKKA